MNPEQILKEGKKVKKISDKMLAYAFEICFLVKDHTGNVIASGDKEGSDIEYHKKASAFIRAYLKYKSPKNKQ